MARKIYISFKAEDMAYKQTIQESGVDYIDKSLNEPINSVDPDYILRRIREDFLMDSTVTVHLIGLYGAESAGQVEQQYIKGELRASLWAGGAHTKSGILGVVLPEAYGSVYRGSYQCSNCGCSHNHVAINDSTTIKEFSCNYYIPNGKCSHPEEDRYCVLVKWDDFMASPESFIEAAFEKRSAPVAAKTRVYP